MRVADILFQWTPSPSGDVVAQKMRSTINSEPEVVRDFPQGLSQFIYQGIPANCTFTWRIESIDSEGKSVLSAPESFQLGDLQDPFPATNLSHEIQTVRDQ